MHFVCALCVLCGLCDKKEKLVRCHEWTEAERYLLERIRQGNQEAWSQLVERYQGRLLAFARRRAPKSADPEDLVQDTFLLFLKGLPAYRGQASVETYLFLILRRRIIELLRVRRMNVCQLPESSRADESSPEIAGPDQHRKLVRPPRRTAGGSTPPLAKRASRPLVQSMQDELNFRDLQVLDLLFYAQWPNRDIAQALKLAAEHVAMVKHRWLKQVRERVAPLASICRVQRPTRVYSIRCSPKSGKSSGQAARSAARSAVTCSARSMHRGRRMLSSISTRSAARSAKPVMKTLQKANPPGPANPSAPNPSIDGGILQEIVSGQQVVSCCSAPNPACNAAK